MKKVLAAAAAAILCFSLSACGTSKQEGNGNGVTYTYKDQTITMKAPPKRIIELSAPLLNMAYAVGGTSAARPETTSPIPEEAKSLPTLGHVQNINMETLVGMKPDLVLGEKNQNSKLESLLKSNKIPYLLVQYDGITDNVPLLKFMGQLYDQQAKADNVIKTYEEGVKAVEDKAASKTPAKVAVLRATGKDVTAETPKSICASMVEMLKMDNVITNHKDIKLDSKTVPYSLEQLSADDPDTIFIVTMGKQNEINKKLDESMRSNPSWAHLKAVQNNRVYFLEPDLFLMNPGIRTPEAMESFTSWLMENKGNKKRGCEEMTQMLPCPTVISTKALRSGEISLPNGNGSTVAGDLSTQSLYSAWNPLPC